MKEYTERNIGGKAEILHSRKVDAPLSLYNVCSHGMQKLCVKAEIYLSVKSTFRESLVRFLC